MTLPHHKTKIVCTIGPASESPAVIEQLIRTGMDVARLNFSHGDFADHQKSIEAIRAASRAARKRVAIMADLPGPKIRIGKIDPEPVELISGETFSLTTDDISGDSARVSVTFLQMPQAVKTGDALFLNDGCIQLEVIAVDGNDIRCRVVVGGELRSRKGLNLPGIDLGISAFTDFDRECLNFALRQGVDAVSQSFIESAADIAALRKAAEEQGFHPFVIAKIERSRALDNIDEILHASDGIMIARGDLGVEIPIEKIAMVQKTLMHKANLSGKPVITATQMLESMTANRRPTRAEATDVANAILDGTDCVMLSAESAAGRYPVESTAMLAKIAGATEPTRSGLRIGEMLAGNCLKEEMSLVDLISFNVDTTCKQVNPVAVMVPTLSGYTARMVSRFKLPVWIIAVSTEESTCQALQFSYGVYPVCVTEYPEDWNSFVQKFMDDTNVTGNLVVLTQGPSPKHPQANHRMELIKIG